MYSKFNFPSLDETVSWLAELENRDKVIRLLTYLSTLVGTSSRVVNILKVDPVEFEKSAKIFSSKLSETRRILRFFDDLPMLRFTLYYGLGEKQHVREILKFDLKNCKLLDWFCVQIYLVLKVPSWLKVEKLFNKR